MNKVKLTQNLQQIKTLADGCLSEIGVESIHSNSKKKSFHSNVSADSRMTLPKYILALRDDIFFKQPKTALEVHVKLQSIYPCDLNRIEVALVRLRKAGKLRKTSKIISGKRIVAYVW